MAGSLEGISKNDLVRLLVENTPVAYIILDKDYRIHYINDNFLQLRNLELKNTLGEKCYNISNGGVPCKNCAITESLITGKKTMISRKDILPNGAVRFVDDYAVPLYKSDDNEYILEIMVNRTPEMVAREHRDQSYNEMLAIFSSLLEAKDTYTATHSSSVRYVAMKLAAAMGLSEKEQFEISVGASLHDIGKVRIPDYIINKTEKLNDEEFKSIKKHPSAADTMLEGLSSFDKVKSIVRHHHERYDGRGYPDGISGDQISLGAKIVAVADTYDAITSTRSYRKALSHEYAIEEIEKVAGSQLDPGVVKVFLGMDWGKEYGSASAHNHSDLQPVERVLAEQSVHSDLSIDAANEGKEFKRIVDQDRVLMEIFDNTPCGYVLMDVNRTVVYASQYFLDFMGFKENEVLGKRCFQAGGNMDGKPCNPCAIARALKSGHVESMRQEQMTGNGIKIFDMFGMPLPDKNGRIDHVIEIIIDRTEEVTLERQREKDFKRLFEVLNELLDEQMQELEEVKTTVMSEEITRLKERLDNLFAIQNNASGARDI